MQKQYETVNALPVEEGVQSRGDCPFCGGNNTFTWTKATGMLKWKCFRASCTAYGTSQKGHTVDSVTNIFKNQEELSQKSFSWSTPSHWTKILPQEEAYLRNFHIFSMLDLQFVRHDPKQNRLCFITDSKQGAVGKYINISTFGRINKNRAKWYNYGDVSEGILAHLNYNRIVIVEDCISAFAVSKIASAITLLGTNLTEKHIKRIKRYSHAIVAFDPDARQKALNITRALRPYVTSYISFLKDDPKYLNTEELKGYLLK